MLTQWKRKEGDAKDNMGGIEGRLASLKVEQKYCKNVALNFWYV